MAAAFVALVVLALHAFPVAGYAAGSSLNITNSCGCSIWPAFSSEAALETMGFELAPSQWRLVAVPFGWTGRVWARTLCSTDSISGKFSCVTGDCGTGSEDCAGGGGAAPVTLAEFRLNGVGGRDSYDVTVVDGFNIPMLVAPGGNECAPTGCIADLNAACPPELRVTTTDAGGGHVVACMSACQAFASPEFCCTGDHGQPRTCTPSVYSDIFKQVCPLVVTYPYDVVSSIYSCGSDGGSAVSAITYTITFCPIIANSVYTNQQPTTTTTPSTGGIQLDAARIALITGVLGLITAALGVLAHFLGLFEKCSGCCCR